MPEVRQLAVLTMLVVVGCKAPAGPDDTGKEPSSFSLQIVAPVENATTCGVVTVQAAVDDARLPVSVTFLIDGTTLATVKEPPYWIPLSTVLFSEGKHVLTVSAVDASQRKAGAARNIQIMRTPSCDNPPAIAFDTSTPRRASKLAVPLKVWVTDDSSVTKVEYYVGTTLFGESTQSPFSLLWDPKELAAGTYDLKAVAYDGKGQTALAIHQVVIDRTPPSVTMISPTNGQSFSRAPKLAATAAATSEVARIDFYVDGTIEASDSVWPYEVMLSKTMAGPHSARAEAWDALGNSATTDTVSFTTGEWSGGCSDRCDCTGEGEICVQGRCEKASVSGSCVRDEDCPLGKLCDFSQVCVAGCVAACDCSGATTCNMTSFQCEACSPLNLCPSGKACSPSGACVEAEACTGSAECAGGGVCKSGVCGFCNADADCGTYGDNFRCSTSGFCTDQCNDDLCRSELDNVRAYCNASNTCDLYECTQDNHCGTDQKCNLTAHICESKGSGGCMGDCVGWYCKDEQSVCSSATCACTTDTTKNLCNASNLGVAVKPDCSACTLQEYLLGSCVDAGNVSRPCAIGAVQPLGYLDLHACL